MSAIELLNRLADSCSETEDAAFWILTSAAAHLSGCGVRERRGSIVAFWLSTQAGRAGERYV